MFAGHLFCGPAIAEVIERKRFASHPLGALQWVGMSVIRKVRRAKDHHPIEYRQNLGLATTHIPVPEFQVAAVFLPPIFVQIQEQIEPPIEAVIPMFVKIGMYRKFTPRGLFDEDRHLQSADLKLGCQCR
jgi:uncharacterized protein (DUF1684 family)